MRQRRTATVSNESVSQAIIELLAESKGVEPLELRPLLYEVIDPDALNRIFAPNSVSDRNGGQLTFSYNEYTVTVGGDGSVAVESGDR